MSDDTDLDNSSNPCGQHEWTPGDLDCTPNTSCPWCHIATLETEIRLLKARAVDLSPYDVFTQPHTGQGLR